MNEDPIDWRPSATAERLRLRAELLARTRAFFAARAVLEVETPLLATTSVTEPNIESLACGSGGPDRLYLQTSPEYAMKRLLAAGLGPIYQLCKAFRADERGDLHEREFTMLEWYRPGFDHHALMDEIDELLAALLGTPPAERVSYAEAFMAHLAIDPHRCTTEQLAEQAAARGFVVHPADPRERDSLLDFLRATEVEPRLGATRPTFLYDFPASQAALARIRVGEVALAERFEVYVRGVELGNGFHELLDAGEQRRRFEADLATRTRRGQPPVPIDERLLAALRAGMPGCSGVAIGFDRLVMLAAGAASIAEVMALVD